MAATETTVTRTDDASGDPIGLFEKDSGTLVQSMALDGEVMGELLSWAHTAGAAENTHEAKGAAGRLFRADVIAPGSGAVRYLMVFDKGSAPVNGDEPVLRAMLPSTAGEETASLALGLYGRVFTSGIQLALSTTPATLTLPGSAEGYFQASYL